MVGLAGIGGFGAVGAVAAMTRTGATVVWMLPSLLGAVAAAAHALASAAAAGHPGGARSGARPKGPRPTRWARPSGRRGFLQAAQSAVIGGAAVVGVFGSRMLGQRSTVEAARSRVVLPTPSGRPAVAPPEADVAGLRYVTTNDTFYRIDTAIVVPRIDPESGR